MSVPGSINQLLIGAAGAGGGGYEIQRSLRFNSGDSPYLSRSAIDSGSSVYKYTASWWMKIGSIGTDKTIVSFATNNAVNGWTKIHLRTDNTLAIFGDSPGTALSVRPSMVFRDPSAWYHCCVSIDTTQSVYSDQIKFTINGVEQTDFAGTLPFAQNTVLSIGEATTHHIGAEPNSLGTLRNYFDGYLADIQVIEGQALSATDFGEYDSNSVWQAIKYAGTYGTNGFKLNFSDTSSNSALGTDSSGQGNNWTVNNLSIGTPNARPYASQFVSSNGFNASYPAIKAFDDSTSTYAQASTSGGTLTFTPSTGISYSSSIKIWMPSAGATASINGGSPVSVANSSETTIATGSGTLTSLVLAASNIPGLAYIKIDDQILVNSGLDADNDALRDSPVNGDSANDTGAGGEITSNYATWNPLFGKNHSLSNGNLKAESNTTAYAIFASTLAMKSGKWYMEYTYTPNNGQPYITWGVSQTNRDGSQGSGVTDTPEDKGFKAWDTGFYSQSNGTNIYDYSSSVSSGDIISLAFDADAGKLWVAKNGTYMTNASGAGNPTAGTNPDYSGLTYSGGYYFMAGPYYTNGSTLEANFGQRAFAFAAPTNYKALCTANLPDPTIADGSTAFNAALYTGNASTQSITGLPSPDLVWIKDRTDPNQHCLYDTVRGAAKALFSSSTAAEQTQTGGMTQFTSTGFNLNGVNSGSGATNQNNNAYVAWAWDAGSSTTTIAVGSLNSSVYNQSAVWSNGFSPAPSISGTGTRAFDGQIGIQGGYFNGGGTWTPSSAITFYNQVEIYDSVDQKYAINGGTQVAITVGAWTTIASTTAASGATLNTINFTRISDPATTHTWQALRIDGKILVDSDITPPNVPSIASTVRANPSAGFSIVKFAMGSGSYTVGHGLGAAPSLLITKSTSNTSSWWTYHESLGTGSYLALNSIAAAATDYSWGAAPTSTVFTVNNNFFTNGYDYIVYCFAPVSGYSSFGVYTGNGSADGPFVYTGFKPAFIIRKMSSGTGGWYLVDGERNSYNVADSFLDASDSDAEGTGTDLDILSNGFKLRNSATGTNAPGSTFVYAAWAFNPFKTSRAR